MLQKKIKRTSLVYRFLGIGFFLLLILVGTITLLQQTGGMVAPQIYAATNPDLDVTYVSQSPKYNRYCVTYSNNVPSLCPGTEDQKRYPDVGEMITYTAHIHNKGPQNSAPFGYSWSVDGQVSTNSAYMSAIAPGEEATVVFQTEWTDQAKQIVFTITPTEDTYSQNNSLSFGTRDLTISYWVETGVYDLFNNAQNFVGTYSFEDWVQAHIAKMNERFSQAQYVGISPNGITDRVRIDKIVVANQLDTGGCASNPMSQDPDLYLIDGRWQATDGTCDNSAGNSGNYQNYFNQYINQIDWGLIHEVTHQLGVIDIYRMNVKNNEPASPNGGVSVTNMNGVVIPYADLNFPVFSSGGLMGAGETAPYNNGTYYENHTAGGLNSNFQKRRGFFGDYLFDTPETNQIKVLDGNGNALANATVSLYQKDVNSENIDDTAEFSGTTDAQGVVTVTNRPVTAFTTATGHTLQANPFGQISPVGTNGLMIVKVTKDDQEGYGFYRLYDLNVAYMSGSTLSATVDIRTNYPKIGIVTPTPTPVPTGTNVALGKTVTASSNIIANGWNKDNAVDGAITSTGSSMGWTSDSNLGVNHTEWIQINLGEVYTLNQIKLYPRTDIPGRFFPVDFQLQVSTNGTDFTTVVDKTNYPNPAALVQSFPFSSVSAQFVKVNATNLMFAENSYRAQFAEIEAYTPTVITPTPTSTPTPTPTSTPTPTPTNTPTPTPSQKTVFVTSTTYTGNLGGASGADAKCQVQAQAAGLGGTYKAWLSSQSESAASRLTHATLPYKLLNGTLIANNWTDLANGTIANTITVTELGTTVSGRSWTNTTGTGAIYGTTVNAHCNNWTDGTSARKGRAGSSSYINSRWTSDTNINCNVSSRLYCVEQ